PPAGGLVVVGDGAADAVDQRRGGDLVVAGTHGDPQVGVLAVSLAAHRHLSTGGSEGGVRRYGQHPRLIVGGVGPGRGGGDRCGRSGGRLGRHGDRCPVI